MTAAAPHARRVGTGEQALLVSAFEAAFEHDPWFAWRYPGTQYAAGARDWFELVTTLVWDRADAWVTPNGEAASLWIRPGEALIGNDDLVRVLSLIERQHGERSGEVMAALLAGRATEPDIVHRLCLYVGVHPTHQGRGLGRAVMEPALEACDREGTVAFLNSTNPRNVPFYERLGFRSTAVSEVAPGITFRSMLREPVQ